MSTLNVRQAAAVSMTSNAIPCRMISIISALSGNFCCTPVPNKMISGSSAIAGSKSAMLSSWKGAGFQSGIILLADKMM